MNKNQKKIFNFLKKQDASKFISLKLISEKTKISSIIVGSECYKLRKEEYLEFSQAQVGAQIDYRITSKGEKELEKSTSNPYLSPKMILAIIGFVTLFLGGGTLIAVTINVGDETDTNLPEIKDGVDGNRYVNQTMGFTIEKPDDTWYFITDLEKFRDEYNIPKPSNVLIDILVAKAITHDTVGVQVRNIVYEVDSDLEKRVTKYLEQKSLEFQIENIEKDVSIGGDYAYFSYDTIQDAQKFHTLRIFKLANDKFYELGAVYEITKPISVDLENDINCITKSFQTISDWTQELTSKC